MLNCILFYDDRGRWWQPGNYLTKVIDSTSDINIYNHGVIPEDIGVLASLDHIDTTIDFILVVDSGKTHHKLHHHKDKIRELKVKTAIWLSDTHIGWEERKRWITEFRYDYVFVAQKDAVQRVIDQCEYDIDRVIWLPHAVDTDIFHPSGVIKKRFDAMSVGFMNQNRERIFPIISELVNFQHRATIWAWSVQKAYLEAKIGINVPVANDPLNMRCFEIGACGIPQVVTYPKNNENGLFDLFKNEIDIFAVEDDDISKLKEIVTRLIMNPKIRETVSDNMYKKIVSKHTYKHRMNVILKTMGFKEIE